MRRPLLMLIAEKRVRTEGQKRGMQYFPGSGVGGGARMAKKAGRRRGK